MGFRKKKAAKELTSESATPRTLFVCVRDRGGKGASCAGSGSRALLTEMRTILASEQIGDDELALRACGCLGLCKQGPVLVAATGEKALEKKPPKVKGKKKSAAVFTQVADAEVREVLRSALLH